jgi:hypothetical protein
VSLIQSDQHGLLVDNILCIWVGTYTDVLYRFVASRRPVTRVATPSTDRRVLAFSMIQCSCISGEDVSAKQPAPGGPISTCEYLLIRRGETAHTLEEVEQSSLGCSSGVRDGRFEVFKL